MYRGCAAFPSGDPFSWSTAGTPRWPTFESFRRLLELLPHSQNSPVQILEQRQLAHPGDIHLVHQDLSACPADLIAETIQVIDIDVERQLGRPGAGLWLHDASVDSAGTTGLDQLIVERRKRANVPAEYRTVEFRDPGGILRPELPVNHRLTHDSFSADGCWLTLSLDHDGGSARAHHEHPATGPHGDGLIVEVDANHGVTSQPGRLFLHLLQGDGLGLAQLLFVRGGAATHDVSDAGKDVAEDV